MEAGAIVAELLTKYGQGSTMDMEIAFMDGVVASLPAGDDLTAAECRVDYLLEKAREERERLAHLAEFTARKIEMLHAYEASEAEKIENRLAWLESRIRDHLPLDAATFRKTYGKKSNVFPNGEAGYRKHPAKIEVTDAAKMLAFARRVGIEVERKVTESVPKAALLEWVVRQGEDVEPETDGLRLVPAHDEFFIRTAKGE